MSKIKNPEILIISSLHDYSTDYITLGLNLRKANYLRLNRDQFLEMNLTFNPLKQKIMGVFGDKKFLISNNKLKTIYFRAPIFLRDNYTPGLKPDEQFSRSQWAAFIRNLVVYDGIRWINHPASTYMAEIKTYQLYIAKKVGFRIPKTIITNNIDLKEIKYKINFKDYIVLKTIDPFILKKNEMEGYIYTNFIRYKELNDMNFQKAPIIIQEAIIPKIDIRVTVIGDYICAVSILEKEKGIFGDWRKIKKNLNYKEIELPKKVKNYCINLIKELKLSFGAIDLALSGDKFFFLEINPTGEWAWLLNNNEIKIDEALVDYLLNEK